jgi:two-component system cell cycle sensor histidine kinase/response regulator CckA
LFKTDLYREESLKEDRTMKKDSSTENLKNSEEKYKYMFENAPDGMCTLDLKGVITSCNKTFQDQSGFSREEIVGKHFTRIPLFKKKFLSKYTKIFKNFIKGEISKPIEIEWTRKDGSIEFSEMHMTFLKENKKPVGFQIIARNISERKRSEEKLRQSEAMLNSILKAAPIGIGVVSKRILKWVNDRLCEMVGYSAEELVGKSALMVYPTPEEFDRVGKEKYDQIRIQGRGTIETQMRCKDGRIIDILLSSAALDPSAPEADVTFTVLDITAQKQAGNALSESEKKFRNIIESMPLGMHMYELKADDRLEFVDYNPAADNILGVDNAQFVGKSAEEAFPALAASQIPKMYRRVAREGTTWKSEQIDYEENQIKGAFEVYAFQTSPGKMVAAFRDITERVQEEQERLLLATAIQQAAEAIIITDKDAVIQYVNPAFEKITGYSSGEAVGRNCNLLKSGEQDDIFYQNLWRTIQEGKIWNGHFINKRRNGTLYREEATISPIKDKTGNITNYVAVKRDVTVEHRMEEQLRQAQKMEAIGTLAGGIAHDFNNILSSIIGYSELSLVGIQNKDRLRSNLEHILKAGERARNLVQQILSFSRKKEYEQKPVQISLVIQEVLEFLRASLPTTIQFRKNIKAKSSIVMADANQIHQVLMNLCTNAAHAMQEQRGVLEIGLIDIELDAYDALIYPGIVPGPFVELTVGDTGSGMEPAVMKRIFDPFFTTKTEDEGTGLGLSVVHGIVKSHGGEITVDSKLGEGTTFHIFLPRVERASSLQAHKIQSLPGGDESILFVDDEPEIVDVTRFMLESLGYTVATATSTAEALDMIQQEPHRFDLLITDQIMPHMMGVELVKNLRQIGISLPVILCTGYSDVIPGDEATTLGIKAILPKPISLKQLAPTIRRVLD